MEKYPDKTEGDLSKARSSIVREEVLVKISKKIVPKNFIKKSKYIFFDGLKIFI